MTRTYIAPLAALTLLLGASMASADPSDLAQDAEGPVAVAGARFDYSRFSDGPRRVPAPRGASFERARRLGLGTREAASRLLHQPVPDAWRRAADWREGEVERLLWPVDGGRYARGYGYVRVTRPDLIHNGVDIVATEGGVVRAAADGIVAYSDNGVRGYGNCVLLVHPNGWVTLYAHNSRNTVQAGWRVARGERIALVGSSGISHGPHVHFELRAGGDAVDPLALFDDGPSFVQRVAQRAAASGRVPQPSARPDDRRTPPPLPAWREEPALAQAATPRSSPSAPAASEEGSGDEDGLADELGGLAIGSEGLLRRLTRFRPTDEMASAAGGRVFRNLLWPMRGGRADEPRGRAPARAGALVVSASAASPVRATADGLVVYSGPAGRRGRTVVLLHRMGWVSVLAGLDELHVVAGQRVQRGEWIAEAARLELEVLVDGRRADPMELLVQVPAPSAE